MSPEEIKAALVLAHRSQDWEAAKVLSQEKERLKRSRKSKCVVCGVAVRKGSSHCKMHDILNHHYSSSLANPI